MHRMISHPTPLPACAAGHDARHILDARRRPLGGHLVECACRQTAKHDDYPAALAEWCQLNGRPAAKAPRSASVTRIGGAR